jgi:hypothetical protein
VDKRAHEPAAAKAKREEAERKQAVESLTCEHEFFTVFDPRLAGSEEVNGRAAWIVELDPDAGANPHCADWKFFGKFHAKLWIDRLEYRAIRIEADNIAPVTWGAFLVRLPIGGLHLTTEQQRHENGVWLASSEDARVTAKALLVVAARFEIHTSYSRYRKFQSDSRLLPQGGN